MFSQINRSKLLTEDEAADVLGISANTLRSWRHAHKGPCFIRLGASVRYAVPDLEAYVNSCTVDPRAAAAAAVT